MLINTHAHTHTRKHTPRETSGPEAGPGLRPRLQVSSAASRGGGSRGQRAPPPADRASLAEAVSQLVAVQLPLRLQAPRKLHSRLPVHTPALAALPIQGRVALPRQGCERSELRQPAPIPAQPPSQTGAPRWTLRAEAFLNMGPLSSLE